jgi:lipopolysaccharide heptosyltransferase I
MRARSASPAGTLRDCDFRRILLIKLSAVGDVVQTIPLLDKLRRRYPAAQIDWLTTPATAELLRHNPAISNIIEFPRQEWSSPWRLEPFAVSARLAARLRHAHYDLVLDLQGQLRSAVFARLSGAPVRIGFDRPRPQAWEASPRQFPDAARRHAWQGAREGSWLAYTHRIPLPTIDVHPVDRYLSVGTMLDLDDSAADFSFPIPQEATAGADAMLNRYGIARTKLVVMAPGTAWETKQWRRDGFAEVARHFLQHGFAVALVGSGRERAACTAVADLAPGAINLAGATTLSELAALIARATICVSNDSGPAHLAVALNRPVVCVFGPTDPIWAGPYQRDDSVVRIDLPCSPCYLRQLSRCSHGHACMQSVSSGTVIERMEDVLRAMGGTIGNIERPLQDASEAPLAPLREVR